MPRLGARGVVLLLLLAFAVYVVLLGDRVRVLVTSGQPVFIVLGLAIAVFPFLGAGLLLAEVRLGRASERLGRRLSDEGGLPADDLPRRPSGRVDRAAADAVFAERKREVEATPEDWRTWFRIALAYGDAGDTARGRKALRHAVVLEQQERATGQ